MARIKGFLSRVVVARAEKRALFQAIEAFSADLRAGVWFASSPTYAHHSASGPMPSHLAATLRQKHPQGALSMLSRHVAGMLAGPSVYRVKGGVGSFSRALITNSGTALLFDTEHHLVLRAWENRRGDYMQRREALSAYFHLPEMIGADERRSIEHMVQGVNAFELPTAPKLRLFDQLIASYAKLTKDHAAARLATPPEMVVAKALLGGAAYLRLERLWKTWPLLASHGDLSGSNILQQADGKFFLLDFEHMDDFPYFFDILLFVIRDPELAKQFAAGKLNDQMASLDRAAQRVVEVDERNCQVLFVLLVLVKRTGMSDLHAAARTVMRRFHYLCQAKGLTCSPL